MREISLYQLGRIVTGRTPPTKQPEYFGDIFPFITPTDIKVGERKVVTQRFLSLAGAKYLRRILLPTNSIAFVCIGATIGKICLTTEPSFSNQQINSIIVDRKKYDVRFIFYALKRNASQIKALAGGAASPIINKTIFSQLKLSVPDIAAQRSIGSILGAYDDLIENNLRRISILEEMVRRIFDEWFVYFLFPGHERVKLVRSEIGEVPEKWEVGELADVVKTLESGSRPKGGIDPNERGVPSIGAENVNGLANYDYTKEKYISEEFFQSMGRGHIESGDVLLYKDGAHIGRKALFRDGYPHEKCAINEHVFILRTSTRLTSAWLYFWLDLSSNTANIKSLNANAAQPGINQRSVKSLPILLPPQYLIRQFNERTEPILSFLFILAKKNTNLRKQRDLLLPKLISGEIDVSDLSEGSR